MEARRIFYLVFLALGSHVCFEVRAEGKPIKALASALYVFGDSTVDPGNNNHLITVVKANFPPYGRDFIDHKPTGRFSNGKLTIDIISSMAGLPGTVPAYLDPECKGDRILTGVSFASAAAGYDDSTARAVNAINLEQQVNYFKEYKARLAEMIGKENASDIISQAIFCLSMGTDDFANNYFINPVTFHEYSLQQYGDLLLRSLSRFVENVYNAGAKKIGVLGLPPMGCLPSQITLHNPVNNTCVEKQNEAAIAFNHKLSALLKNVKFNGLKIIYIDIYKKLIDAIKNPNKYGFKEARKGCCGTGLLETAILCNKHSPTCGDASKYVFWDSYHPTETMYRILAYDIFGQAVSNHFI